MAIKSTLLEQANSFDNGNNSERLLIKADSLLFSDIKMSQASLSNYYKINIRGGVSLIISYNSSTKIGISPETKDGKYYNNFINNLASGRLYTHNSSNKYVRYCKITSNAQNADDINEPNACAMILAQDENDEWVVFQNNRLVTQYGDTGVFTNTFNGEIETIVDENNQFIITPTYRVDTGARLKELYTVLSARSYVDHNCIIQKGDKFYRLVSLAANADETKRYPAFAFPVSDE